PAQVMAIGAPALVRWPVLNDGTGALVIAGLVVSRVMEWLDAVETAPAPFLNSTNTVLTPSPAGRVNEVLDANGTHAPKVLPSLEKRMSRTGSPAVGLEADRLSVTVVLLVNVAPELTEIVPDGTAVSRYRVYEPEPPLLF